MIEVAIVSMEQALVADGEPLPGGSGTLPREPLRLPGSGVPSGASATPSTGGAPPIHEAHVEAVAPITIDPPLPGV
jgi:hypothetical protein